MQGQFRGGDVAYPHHLWSARQEVQDPDAERGVQTQSPKLGTSLILDFVHQLLFTNRHRPPPLVLPETAVLSSRWTKNPPSVCYPCRRSATAR